MDQFLSSISESQPDVTMSSEESMEVPTFDGKPFRPFQVNSLGSHPEPEGEWLATKMMLCSERRDSKPILHRCSSASAIMPLVYRRLQCMVNRWQIVCLREWLGTVWLISLGVWVASYISS